MEKGRRQSNLELLRIFSMFCIVLHHYAYHGSIDWAINFNKNILPSEQVYLFLCCFGKAAVVSFVLIGAYFLSEKRFKFERIINLCSTTFVYSWIIYLVLLWKFPKLVVNIPMKFIWLPIPIPSNYWFVIAYVYMLLCMPFMNLLLRHLNRRQILILLLLMFLCWNILQFVINKKPDNDQWNFFNNNNYFLFIYLIAGYIRKYKPRIFSTIWLSLIMLLVSVSCLLFLIWNVNKSNYGLIGSMMATLNNPFSLMIGVTLFGLFLNINIGSIGFINFISKSMFGVYLIHDNSFIRPFLWHVLVNSHAYVGNAWDYLEHGFVVCLSVFACCIVIDIIKRFSIDLLVNKIMIRVIKIVSQWTNA